MNTPMLFEVEIKPRKVEAFKAAYQIETHYCGSFPENPWLAIHLPSARKFGYGLTERSDLFDCVSKVGRLLDESGIAGYGDTEADAIIQTCKACGITVLPSDL